MSESLLQTCAGIHLSGPNAHKTSVVIMTGGLREGNLKISHVFEKIGAIGRLFSDERILEIVKATNPQSIFIDCPLTEPPCVACSRPMCPGVNACEDLGVALMQSMANKKPSAKRRKRPINPQTQRVWDVKRWVDGDYGLQEPSYSANMAPLVVRAKTLQRRLRNWDSSIELKETSVPLSIRIIGEKLHIPSEWIRSYRSFGVGKEVRSNILEILVKEKWVDLNHLDIVEATQEVFHSFIAAIVASLYHENRVTAPSNCFESDHGWVYLPNL